MTRQEKIAQMANRLRGRPFRLHGRDPVHGLDCIGLVHACLDHAGIACKPPNGYSVRAGSPASISSFLTQLGLRCLDTTQAAQTGDIVLVRPGAMQMHLIVRTGSGFVHADAGIGKVVSLNDPIPWPTCAVFRVQEE